MASSLRYPPTANSGGLNLSAGLMQTKGQISAKIRESLNILIVDMSYTTTPTKSLVGATINDLFYFRLSQSSRTHQAGFHSDIQCTLFQNFRVVSTVTCQNLCACCSRWQQFGHGHKLGVQSSILAFIGHVATCCDHFAVLDQHAAYGNFKCPQCLLGLKIFGSGQNHTQGPELDADHVHSQIHERNILWGLIHHINHCRRHVQNFASVVGL